MGRKKTNLKNKLLYQSILATGLVSAFFVGGSSQVIAEEQEEVTVKETVENIDINELNEENKSLFLEALLPHQEEEYIEAFERYTELLLNEEIIEVEDLQLVITELQELAENEQSAFEEYDEVLTVLIEELKGALEEEFSDEEDLSEEETDSTEEGSYEEIDESEEVQNEELTEDDSEQEESEVSSEASENLLAFSAEVSSDSTADELFAAVENASTASNAWNAAQEFKDAYPEDNRVVDALDMAAIRILSLGQSNHRNGNYSNAISYYIRVVNENLVSEGLRESASTLLAEAEAGNQLKYASTYYDNVVNAPTATAAWNAAQTFKNLYPNDSRLEEAFHSAAERNLAMGRSSQRTEDFSSAITFYRRLVNEPLVDAELRLEVEILLEQSENGIPLKSAAQHYQEVVNASNATSAWNAAQEFQEAYPNDPRVSDAINMAVDRMLSMGQSNHRAGNYSNAIFYYSRIVNEPAVNSSLQNEASVYLTQAENGQNLRTADSYYRDSINASTATSAWNIAVEGNEYFPNNAQIQRAINEAASRILSLAQSNHRNGSFAQAITYYNRLLNEPSVETSYRESAAHLKSIAEAEEAISYAVTYYNNVLNANTATAAWNNAQQFKEVFPNDSRVNSAIASAADRIFALGVSNHRNRNYSTASTYYRMLINEPLVSSEIRSQAESYLYLAQNERTLTNTVFRNYQYDQTFQQALNDQMNRSAPVTDARGNGWQPATRAEVQRYLNPNNFIPDNLDDVNMLLSTARVTSSTLNIRTGPGTSYPVIGSASEGEKFAIVGERNGWYEIALEGNTGWISGSTSYTYVDHGVLQFLDLSYALGIPTSELNTILSGAGILNGTGSAFSQAANRAGINEIYLISHALLETGNGTSRLARGVEVEGIIVYNMFGIGAVDSDPIGGGARTAYEHGWDTPEKAIIGGAEWVANRYINGAYKQNTLYKMRWNPENPNRQYATDVAWAYKQTRTLGIIARLAQQYDLVLNFDIPNYR